jgi:type IV secretory pathway TrbF-like protein
MLRPALAYTHMCVAKPDPNDEFRVVKTLMQMFAEMLRRVAADPSVHKFLVVPTQGTLEPTAADWQNEIHPSPAGFAKIAQKFQTALASAFP